MTEINAVDSCYMLANAGLVLLMTPGLALFYGGLVREKATTDMMWQNIVVMGTLTVLWVVIGFSMSFGTGTLVGGFDFFLWNNVKKHEPWPLLTISMELFALYQMMFAIITPILMTGTFADRMRPGAFLVFTALWSILVYYPWCHQIWGGGFFQTFGVWDFAGGIVVHSTAGWSALATALALGPRKAIREGKDLAEPHSVPFVVIGTGLLWFGWLGFNGGSALAMNEIAVTAALNSQIAAATAVCVWGGIDRYMQGKTKLVPLCIAAVAGLVVVTPSCGYIQPHEAVIVGMVAGSVCYGAILLLKNKLKVDDALDVVGVHGVGGTIGTILIGVLADGPECIGDSAPDYCVFPHSVAASASQVLKQLIGVGACIVYSFNVTFALIKIMMLVMPVKPDEAKFDNLDEDLHGEPSYTYESVAAATAASADVELPSEVSFVDREMSKEMSKTSGDALLGK